MLQHIIGTCCLNIATGIYFIWFIPQLRLTFQRRATQYLSFGMHNVLITAYLADFAYGVGNHFPLQYQLVSFCGLLYLSIQHVQFGLYANHHQRRSYRLCTLYALTLLCLMIYGLFNVPALYNSFGLIAVVSWLCCFLPQVVTNYRNHTTAGLSFSYVMLSAIASVCDIIAAYALGWNWPSKVGAPLGLVQKSILLYQFREYRDVTP